MTDKLTNSCHGKTKSNGGFNLPEFKKQLIYKFPNNVMEINKLTTRKELENLCLRLFGTNLKETVNQQPIIKKQKSPQSSKHESPNISKVLSVSKYISQLPGNPIELLHIVIATLPHLDLDYTLLKRIAEGGNSDIFLARNKTGKHFAVKIPYEDREQEQLIIDEANILGILSDKLKGGPFLEFYGLYSLLNRPVIVMEYFQGKLIYEVKNSHDPSYIRWVTKQIFEGLYMLHKHGFIHGDFHFGNIMVNDEKLVIFDLSGCSFKDNMPIDDLNCPIPQYNHMLRTTPQIWHQIKDDPNLQILRPSLDIFDAAIDIRSLLGFTSPSSYEYESDPQSFRINIADKVIQEIINQSIDPDPRKRPTAEQIVIKLSSAGI